MKITAKVNIPKGFEKALEAQLEEAMKLTMAELRDDVIKAQTMPFDNGDLIKSTHTEVESDGKKVSGYLISDTPYARFQYYGKLMIDPNTGSSYAKKGVKKIRTDIPLKYQTANNPNANSEWLDEYRDGKFLQERFTENLREVRKGK